MDLHHLHLPTNLQHGVLMNKQCYSVPFKGSSFFEMLITTAGKEIGLKEFPSIFPWVLVHIRFVCALQEWSLCFPQSYGGPVTKFHWPSMSDSLGILSTFADPQAGEPDVGLRTFTTVRELLWYYCSPVCRSPDRYAAAAPAKLLQLCPPHQPPPSLGFSRQEYWSGHPTGIGFDFIVIVPLLPSCWGFSVVLGHGVSFLGGFQCLSVYGCSTTSCDFGALGFGVLFICLFGPSQEPCSGSAES